MGGDDRFWIGVFLGVIAGIAAMAAFGAFWTGTVTLPPAFCGQNIDNPTCVREWGIAIGTLSAALVGMGSLFQLRREHLQRRQREWENEEGLFLVHVADMLNAVEFKPWEKRVFDAMDTQLKAVCLNNYISRASGV